MPTDAEARVRRADVLSVDLVGTVLTWGLCRRVDLFRLAHEQFNATSHYLSEDLASRRFEAEAELHRSRGGTRSTPVTVREVYLRLGQKLSLDPETCSLLAENEQNAEASLLKTDTRGVRLVEIAAERGRPIVAWCDTPLRRQRIERVLHELGVQGITDLVIPGEDGVSAQSRWVDLVKRFPGRDVVHVGPAMSERSAAEGITVVELPDPVVAYLDQRERAGVLNGRAVRDRLEADALSLPNVHRSMVNAVVARRLVDPTSVSDAYVLGYGALGPVLLTFVQWLHLTATGAGCRSLAFSSSLDRFVQTAYRGWWTERGLPGGETLTASETIDGTALVTLRPTDADDRVTAPRNDDHRYPLILSLAADAGDRAGPSDGVVAFEGSGDAPPGPSDAVLPLALRLLAPSDVAEWVEVQLGALDFVTDHRQATVGLASTVAVVDRATGWENLALAAEHPSPAASRLFDL